MIRSSFCGYGDASSRTVVYHNITPTDWYRLQARSAGCKVQGLILPSA